MREEQLLVLLNYIDEAILTAIAAAIVIDADAIACEIGEALSEPKQVVINAICFDKFEE